MDRLISLAAGVVLDISPEEAVDVAAAAGYSGVGIWFDPKTWTAQRATDVRSRLDATGMVALDIEPIMLSADGDVGERLIEAGHSVGARFALIASRHSDEEQISERLLQLCDAAVGSGLTLVLEFLPALGVKTLAQASRLVTAINRPELCVLVDSLHLARAKETPSDIARLPSSLFPYVQLADAPLVPPGEDYPTLIDEALNGRLLPGEGKLPLIELLRTVPAVPVSVELRSRALMSDFPDPIDRATAVLSATSAVCDAA
jgi:sugar phosphate isomerase/epimerase